MKIEPLELLGQSKSAPLVKEFLRQVGLSPEKIKLKRGDSEAAFEFEDIGFDVNFVDPEGVHTLGTHAEGDLVIGAVFMYAKDVQGHRQFGGALPQSLQFALARKEVHALLGSPGWSSPALPIDRWSVEAYDLTIWFTPDSIIQHVIAHLRKK